MLSNKVLKKMILPKLLLVSIALITLSACASVSHPITGDDVFRVPKKSWIKINKKGEREIVKDGWFFSDKYVEDVVQIKID